LLLAGRDDRAEAVIRACLERDNQFVAEQVGVPALYEKYWQSVDEGPSNLDHAFHEFVGIRVPGPDDQDLPVWGSWDQMIQRMKAAARRWDVTLSPNCDL